MPRWCVAITNGNLCGSGPRPKSCHVCAKLATIQCDGQPPNLKRGTCSRHLCEGCAQEVGPDLHLCPECFGNDSRWPKKLRQRSLL